MICKKIARILKILKLHGELIFIKNKNNEFSNKTDDISKIYNSGSNYKISFLGNDKSYNYSFDKVTIVLSEKQMSLEDYKVYRNNSPLYNTKSLMRHGLYTSIKFKNGTHLLYNSIEINIHKNMLCDFNTEIEYFRKAAECIGNIDPTQEVNYLSKQYKKIDYISEHSVLPFYLGNQHIPLNTSTMKKYIFPFGFNNSQRAAVINAFNSNISVIEGPPGTGKTQTILNIICNAIMADKNIAIVSNNNSATQNVLEKLQKEGLGFLVASLGSKSNISNFIENQDSSYPNISDWKLSASDTHSHQQRLNAHDAIIRKMLEAKNERSRIKSELQAYILELSYFKESYTNNVDIEIKTFKRLSSSDILRLKIELENTEDTVSLFSMVKLLFSHGIYSFSLYKTKIANLLNELNFRFYKNKITELEKTINKLDKKLSKHNLPDMMNMYSHSSMKLFKSFLFEKYMNRKDRKVFDCSDLWRGSVFDDLVNEYPVILSSTHSIVSSLPKQYLMDYVVVDEASQVDVITGVLSLSCAKNIVVVGDEKQLPNIVSNENKETIEALFYNYDLNPAYNCSKYSFLASIKKIFSSNIPKVLLREHYRCHPNIIGFCNQKFYDNQLIILTSDNDIANPIVVYFTARGNHARKITKDAENGTENKTIFSQRQIDVIVKEVLPELSNVNCNEIGIVSPYTGQRDELAKSICTNIEVDTIHKFQGREKDIIIMTSVVDHIIKDGFADGKNLINVAVSRAKSKFILIVNPNVRKNKTTNIYDLIGYIEYNNGKSIKSKVCSVFDLLYKEHNKELQSFVKKLVNISDNKSENIMATLLNEILKIPLYSNLRYHANYSLNNIVKDFSLLNKRESSYVRHHKSHVDFYLYNKFNKQVFCAIEVDGYAFHNNSEDQSTRDSIKDEIFNKIEIPLIRFSTIGSNEKNRIIEFFNSIYET